MGREGCQDSIDIDSILDDVNVFSNDPVHPPFILLEDVIPSNIVYAANSFNPNNLTVCLFMDSTSLAFVARHKDSFHITDATNFFEVGSITLGKDTCKLSLKKVNLPQLSHFPGDSINIGFAINIEGTQIPFTHKQYEFPVSIRIISDSTMGGECLMEASDELVKRAVNLLVNCVDEDEASLFNKSRDFSSLDAQGYSLLHYSILFNRIDILKLILKAGGTPNELTGDQSSCLHLAAYTGNLDICKAILFHVKYSIPLSHRNKKGKTVADIATQRGHIHIYNFLESFNLVNFDLSTNSTPSSPVKGLQVESSVDNLREAMSQLNLKNRCSLSMSVALGCKEPGLKDFVKPQAKNYIAAIKAMNPDERQEIEDEALEIKKNIRKWLLQKNMDATVQLMNNFDNSYFSNYETKTNLHASAARVQALGKGFIARKQFKAKKKQIINAQKCTRMLLARKDFLRLQKRVKSILVIQHFVRNQQHKKRKRSS